MELIIIILFYLEILRDTCVEAKSFITPGRGCGITQPFEFSKNPNQVTESSNCLILSESSKGKKNGEISLNSTWHCKFLVQLMLATILNGASGQMPNARVKVARL